MAAFHISKACPPTYKVFYEGTRGALHGSVAAADMRRVYDLQNRCQSPLTMLCR